jgi:hypothetical protein
MAFSFSLFSNWAVGLINGYKQKENGLPNNIKYGTMGITTSLAMIRSLAEWDKPPKITNSFISAAPTPGQKIFGLFIGVPIVMGMNFCVGHHLGKAIRYAEDEPRSGKSGVRIQLL